ncbi:phosphoribosylformylglycinamidine synthase subunit PurQ, partial [Arenimonas sp.]|uniref:phosphoribosylformylglycinamidine synthase subunit PurQ n=1 Tax=Arenimonas sp. TaxID=1872635 RepID=UPI002E3197C1
LNPLLLAYHDRSDGGLFAAACEMAFAGRCGVTLNLDAIAFDAAADDVDAFKRNSDEQLAGRMKDLALGALFSEELGALLQVRAADRDKAMALLRGAGLGDHSHVIGSVNASDEIRLVRNARAVYAKPRVELQRAWSETTWRMQSLRDNPESAQQEYDRILDVKDPGLSVSLSFSPSSVLIGKGARPRVAILREQGVNGQVEMAAAFDRAGFTAVDVHMSDLIAGRVRLDGFKGLAACGGFSYGDVLGAGRGWATSILERPDLREQFARFFERSDSFSLGVCNGCQMLAQLKGLVPGAEHWPRFLRNRSEQYEARLAQVEVQDSPSILFAGMAGSRIPVVVAHGEGQARFDAPEHAGLAQVALRFVDGHGQPTEAYPANPNGSPAGITGLTSRDGRATLMMPHPERVFRSLQMSWHPAGWGEDSPWMRIFRNARAWVA